MELLKVPMYLRDLRFKTEQDDGDEVRIVVAAFRLAPFTPELCDVIAPRVKTRIFGREGNPVDDILTLTAGVHSGDMLMELHSAPDTTRPVMRLQYVQMDPKLRIRRDRETPVFEATLLMSFAYPEAKHLLALAHALNTQMFVSLEDMQPALEESGAGGGDDND